jgi:LmbE family N-acetylglucosaminyl deacetylase
MPETADVMVISPHADDAEGGCGGTVAKWIKEGKSVVYVLCTNGDKGTGDPAIKPEQLAATREKEQLAAADVLGVREVIFLRHPDQGLEETPEFRKELVRLIRMYRPDTVISVDPYRKYIWHRDHRITGQVVLDAVFPYARDLYAYPDMIREGLEPFKVKEVLLWASEEPNYNVDITDVFDMKVKALRCHESQVGAAPLVEMEQRIKERSWMYAEGEDYELAESFHRVELFR